MRGLSLRLLKYSLLLAFTFATSYLAAQSTHLPPAASEKATPHTSQNLAGVVRSLPDYDKPGMQLVYAEAFEKATPTERDAAAPSLISWLQDSRPKVRALALVSLGLLYLPPEHQAEPRCSRFLPPEYIPAVAARFKDVDPRVRKATFFAVQSVASCGHGAAELLQMLLPRLSDPDSLTLYPDPDFTESDERLLSTLPPEAQLAFRSRPHHIVTLPAEGPMLLPLVLACSQPLSPAVEEDIIAFLDRKDQTKASLAESLHNIALSSASERINDEALARVFALGAMDVFSLQFVSRLRLSPAQLAVQRERLLALSDDAAQASYLRSAARTVLACWNGDPHAFCSPTPDEMQSANNASH